MTDAEQSPFPVAENAVSSAADAIAALLSGNANATRDPADVEEEAERTEAQQPQPVIETQAQPEAEDVQQPEETAQAETEAVESETPEKVEPEAKAETPATEVKADPKIAAEDETLAQLNNLVPQLQAAIAASFPEVKNWDDLVKLGRDDPTRYNEYVIRSGQLQQAQQAQAQLAAGAHQRFMQTQLQELKAKFPDYVDPVKGAALRAEFTAYAKKLGYSEERMRVATAADILLLRNAMQYEKLQSQQAKKPVETAKAIAQAKDKAAKAPPVQKPGVARDEDKNQRVTDSYKRLQQTGRVNDAAELFKRLGVV